MTIWNQYSSIPPKTLPKARMPEPGSVVLVGPSGTGKSSFLLSLGRAFESGRCAGWKRFVPGRKLVGLMKTPSAGNVPEATYTFQLGVTYVDNGSGIETDEEMEVSVLDTPDDFFDTLSGSGAAEMNQEQLENLLRATLNARCLVLFCPANGRRVDFTGVVNALLTRASRRVKRMGAKPWPQRESPWERAPRLELPFERVLVLLTDIGHLCDDVVQRLAKREARWAQNSADEIRTFSAHRDLNAWEVAELLDLWPLLRRRAQGFDLITASLKPGAQLAVCGIDTTFWSGPFGIWPALFFMITGRVIAPVSSLEQRSAETENWLRLNTLVKAPGEER